MPEQYTLQEAPKPQLPPEPDKKNMNKYFVMAGVGIGFICIFALGLVLGRGGSSNTPNEVANPTPVPSPLTSTEITPFPSNFQEIPLVNFLPNKQYLDDTFVVVSQDKPHQTLILSISRIEQQHNFTQYTKTNYFDGSSWDRKSTTAVINTSIIATNPLLRSWTPPILNSSNSPSSLATLTLPKNDISFTSSELNNEVSVQSTPGSTKFIYQGKGTITINDDIHPAYVFYSRTYSFNAVDLSYLTKPDQVISNWLLFWDKEGTFYYIDDHKGLSGTESIPSFALGVIEEGNTILRTPSESTSIGVNNTVSTYNATFDFDRDTAVFLPVVNPLNKSNKKTYSWVTTIGEGTAVKAEGRKVSGLGVAEYIRQNQ
jgi:hypothetical protein